MISLNNENLAPGTPTPPWQVMYVNDADKKSDQLPEAYTDGLLKFNCPELIVRHAPPNAAAMILDRLGAFLIFDKQKVSLGDTIEIFGSNYLVSPFVRDGKPFLRLAWPRDPVLSGDDLIKSISDFRAAIGVFKLPCE